MSWLSLLLSKFVNIKYICLNHSYRMAQIWNTISGKMDTFWNLPDCLHTFYDIQEQIVDSLSNIKHCQFASSKYTPSPEHLQNSLKIATIIIINVCTLKKEIKLCFYGANNELPRTTAAVLNERPRKIATGSAFNIKCNGPRVLNEDLWDFAANPCTSVKKVL